MLRVDGVRFRLVEGSAVAAEVFLAETNTRHTAVRVGVFVAPAERREIESVLRRAGFRRSEPVGDITLIRLAARRGQRAVHVLREGDGAVPSGDGHARLHPGDPAAARARIARLSTAWLDLAAVYCRSRYATRPGYDVTESFEVQLIEEPAARRSQGLMQADRVR